MKNEDGEHAGSTEFVGMRDGEQVGPFIFRIYEDEMYEPFGALEYHLGIKFALVPEPGVVERSLEYAKRKLAETMMQDLKSLNGEKPCMCSIIRRVRYYLQNVHQT